uniref:Uncharacterized protein n=1 Tax=viral metagenome TaxID=1070528 RepID=A0A6C0JI34_9ZZZZ
MDQVICNGELNYNKNKGLSGDYANCYGTITFSKKTALDALLIKTGRTNDLPQYFVGKFRNGLICQDHPLNCEDIYDEADMERYGESDLYDGTEIIIKNNTWSKKTTFRRKIVGTFYKWQTARGLFMIASQSDIDKLNEKEKNYLKIN